MGVGHPQLTSFTTLCPNNRKQTRFSRGCSINSFMINEYSHLHLGSHLQLLLVPVPLEGLDEGVDLCNIMVMGEGTDKVRQHSRIT